jgi:hypothetical protein
LLSPLLEPSLLFFLLSVRSLLGAVAVTPPKKKKIICTRSNCFALLVEEWRVAHLFLWNNFKKSANIFVVSAGSVNTFGAVFHPVWEQKEGASWLFRSDAVAC